VSVTPLSAVPNPLGLL